MEMEPGSASLKKLKLAAVKSREEAQAPPATQAPGSDPTASARTTPPPPADDGDDSGVDRISSLPDPILGEIVSLLRTKQGARTQILSTRWRHIWRSAPLNLDCRHLPVDKLERVVAEIISTHPGTGRRFRIPAYYLQARAATVDAWLRSPALDRLQELEFGHIWNYRPPELPRLPPLAPPPASAFRFSPTLRIVTIGRCLLPDSTIEGLHLPQLKQLGIEWVSISEGVLRNLVARCPALECLLIYYISGLRCARINSLGLISIGVRMHRRSDHHADELQLRELIIENAPCLERLLRLDILDGLLVSVISAPKLETLGSVYGEMYLNSTVLQSVGGDLNLWKRKHRNLFKCLDIRLKTVVMQSYRGIRAQVNFATFFILNAKALKLMRFEVDANDYTRGFFAEMRKELLLEKRASRGARFCFQTGRPLRCHSEISNVRDLDLSDPFICKRRTQARSVQEFFLPI